MLPSGVDSMCCYFNDTATTEIYTLSLHDALPIWHRVVACSVRGQRARSRTVARWRRTAHLHRRPRRPDGSHVGLRPQRRLLPRSEEHTSELQSRQYLVCRLLLEKKNEIITLILTL